MNLNLFERLVKEGLTLRAIRLRMGAVLEKYTDAYLIDLMLEVLGKGDK